MSIGSTTCALATMRGVMPRPVPGSPGGPLSARWRDGAMHTAHCTRSVSLPGYQSIAAARGSLYHSSAGAEAKEATRDRPSLENTGKGAANKVDSGRRRLRDSWLEWIDSFCFWFWHPIDSFRMRRLVAYSGR